jgi:hypothetical protein
MHYRSTEGSSRFELVKYDETGQEIKKPKQAIEQIEPVEKETE